MGRAQKNGVMKLQAKIWFAFVKHAMGYISNYKLDVKFDKQGRSGHERTRRFDNYENGSLPRKYTPSQQKAGHKDIVELVELEPGCSGSKAVISSPYWDLLSAEPNDRKANQKVINSVTKQYQLAVLSGEDIITGVGPNGAVKFSKKIKEYLGYVDEDKPSVSNADSISKLSKDIFSKSINKALGQRIRDLDKLALLGALYRNAFYGMNITHVKDCKESFEYALKGFCASQWLPKELKEEFSFFAEARILNGLSDVTEFDKVKAGASQMNAQIRAIHGPNKLSDVQASLKKIKPLKITLEM